MENQKLLDLENDFSEPEPKTISSVTNDGILNEDINNSHENDNDDLILKPEKVVKAEKQSSFENTFEVISQESKMFSGVDEDTENVNISKDEESEIVLGSDIVASVKSEDVATFPKAESKKNEEIIVSKKQESKVNDNAKIVKVEENEPVDAVQLNVKIEDTPEAISIMSTKKDSDEGDVCDIKIGPEELFCRIGLGMMLKIEIVTNLL